MKRPKIFSKETIKHIQGIAPIGMTVKPEGMYLGIPVSTHLEEIQGYMERGAIPSKFFKESDNDTTN